MIKPDVGSNRPTNSSNEDINSNNSESKICHNSALQKKESNQNLYYRRSKLRPSLLKALNDPTSQRSIQAFQDFEDTVTSNLMTYLASFDGTPKTFQDIRPQFENVFSDIFIHTMDATHSIVDREGFVRYVIEFMLRERMVATLEDLYFVDDTHLEYTVHWKNEEYEEYEDVGETMTKTSGVGKCDGMTAEESTDGAAAVGAVQMPKESAENQMQPFDDQAEAPRHRPTSNLVHNSTSTLPTIAEATAAVANDEKHTSHAILNAKRRRKGLSMVSHSKAVLGPEGKIIKVEPCEETRGVFANLGSFRNNYRNMSEEKQQNTNDKEDGNDMENSNKENGMYVEGDGKRLSDNDFFGINGNRITWTNRNQWRLNALGLLNSSEQDQEKQVIDDRSLPLSPLKSYVRNASSAIAKGFMTRMVQNESNGRESYSFYS